MSKVDIGVEEIKRILPHRPPFLFVDQVIELEPREHILALRTLRPDEVQFAGHFPGRPIMPGVLITEALAQTAGLLHGLSAEASDAEGTPEIFYLARADMKWITPCHPGDTLMLHAKLVKEMGGLMAFSVRAFNARSDVASGSLTLATPKDR
jgi:3-hydroxyacyl-[acyl-carrier-protein] dehydratase